MYKLDLKKIPHLIIFRFIVKQIEQLIVGLTYKGFYTYKSHIGLLERHTLSLIEYYECVFS
jgi:hypothetical protein